MKNEEYSKQIMGYVEGVSDGITDPDVRIEADEIKQLLSELKEIPLQKVSVANDERMEDFIQHKTKDSKSVGKLNTWVPYFAIAASIVLLLFVFTEGASFEEEYSRLRSNPEKLSFVYDLNKERLDSDDIQWLKSELGKEENPNIQVTIIDLLDGYESELDSKYYENLQAAAVPSVQMALLNSLEGRQALDFSQELSAFSARKDLDQMVRSRAINILENQSKQY